MKIAIIYSSTYLGNTRKIAEAMGDEISAEVMDVDEAVNCDLSQYDVIGLGSAIHFAQHDIRLQEFIKCRNIKDFNVFIFSTRCRPFLGKYHSTLKDVLKQKGAVVIGEFSCVGYDRTGPWVVIDGYNKNRPNEKDTFKARLFAAKMRRKIHPLSQVIQLSIIDNYLSLPIRQLDENKLVGKIVSLNLSTCIGCGKCFKQCPMNVFEKQLLEGKEVILPVHELNCIQCLKCYKNCPADSIFINESFKIGFRIAIWEMINDKLQNSYKRNR